MSGDLRTASTLGSIPSATPTMTTLLSRVVLFAFLWFLLTGGSATSWWVGLPVILVAALSSSFLVPRASISVKGVLGFIPFFAWHSLRGGLDVARRALHPRMPISPRVFDYPLRIESGLPRVVMVNVINLLPGTLGVSLRGNRLRIHALNFTPSVYAEVRKVEQGVARIFGAVLPEIVARSRDEKV